MNTTLRITRDKSFVGAIMPYRIKIDGREITKISTGGDVVINVPMTPFKVDIEMVGNSMNFHPIRSTLNIDPRHSKSGCMYCHLTTKPNWAGIIVSGLFFPIGKLVVNFNYK